MFFPVYLSSLCDQTVDPLDFMHTRHNSAGELLWGTPGLTRFELAVSANDLPSTKEFEAFLADEGPTVKPHIYATRVTLKNMHKHVDEADVMVTAAKMVSTRTLVIDIGAGDLPLEDALERVSILSKAYGIRVLAQNTRHDTMADLAALLSSGVPYSLDMESLDFAMVRSYVDTAIVEKLVSRAAMIKVSGWDRTMLRDAPWWYEIVGNAVEKNATPVFTVANFRGAYMESESDVLIRYSQQRVDNMRTMTA